MNALLLAWRNLLRNRRRSLVTLFAMALGLTTVLLFGGYVRDIQYAMQTDFVRRSGHLQVQHKDYFLRGSGNPAAYGVQDYEAVINLIEGDEVLAPLLVVVTPTLHFGGIAGNFAAEASRTVLVTGIVPDEQNLMRQWNDYRLDFVMPPVSLQGTSDDSVVLGVGVARVLKLCTELQVTDCEERQPAEEGSAAAAELPEDLQDLTDAMEASALPAAGGAKIEILANGPQGAPNVASVHAVAAEFQGVKELDEVALTAHLPLAQRLVYGAAPKQVTAIQLQLRHTADLDTARDRLAAILEKRFPHADLAIVDFETLNPFYGQTIRMFDTIFGFMSVLIGGIVLFTVINTMSMMVVERTVEIGTLRAIGLRRNRVRRMFVIEGLVLGAAAAVMGILSSLVLAEFVNRLRIQWVPPSRVEPVPLSIGISGDYGLILGAAVALIVLACVSSFVPAARAARLNIVDALRHA